jgi:hypothetical protein
MWKEFKQLLWGTNASRDTYCLQRKGGRAWKVFCRRKSCLLSIQRKQGILEKTKLFSYLGCRVTGVGGQDCPIFPQIHVAGPLI